MALDKFAGIAAGGMDVSGTDLTPRSVRKPELKYLPVWECSGRNPAFENPESPGESLAHRMLKLRAHYAPFLERCAPGLAETRERLSLTTFDWRIMTDADRRDFLQVFEGGGS